MIGSTKHKLLLIYNDGATLYATRNKQLVKIDQYQNSPNELNRFQSWLVANSDAVFSIVVDCLEEDFRHENVVHVSGRDRSIMLERKLGFMFRSTPFRKAIIIGREKEGRRDDKALFTALSRTEIIDPWLNAVLSLGISVRAISSAPYLIEGFARQQKFNTRSRLLLVTIEPHSGVRQCYLQKGQVLFSRLTPLSLIRDNDLVSFVCEQALQTRKYLERIKLIPYEYELDVMIFSSEDGQSQSIDDATNHMKYQFVSPLIFATETPADTRPGLLEIAIPQGQGGSRFKNIYGHLMARRYYFLSNLRRMMYATSAIVLLQGSLTAAPAIMSGMQVSEQTTRTRLETTPLLTQYEELREGFPDTPIASNTMALIVGTHDKIVDNTINPGKALVQISQSLGQIPNIHLTQIDWALEPVTDGTQPEDMYGAEASALATSYMRATLEDRLQVRIVIAGTVQASESLRSARDQVLDFMAGLSRHQGMTVTAEAMPVDLNADTALNIQLNDNAISAAFRLSVLMDIEEARL